MPIPNETIARINDALDIVDVIGDYVTLKKKGQNFWALSPFSSEKTPSFSVSPSKGIFKDFSSGKGGDAVKFVMEIEGVGYVEALKILAKKYGIEVEEEFSEEDSKAASERESLFIILNFAKDQFRKNLFESDSGKTNALSYLKERGFLEKTIQDFEIGYSLENWSGFADLASANQFNLDLVEKAGMIIRKEKKIYDRFRGRVMFPIQNTSGKVVAFGGRIIGNKQDQPKYINSPETPIYEKGKLLFGLFQGKNEIRNQDECYLMEGYTDVISFHQAGIKNAVASSGTALTPDQIKLIGRFTPNITMLYDGDKAGLNAASRALDLILEAGYNPGVVVFPDNSDPDEFLRSRGLEETQKILTSKKDFISFKSEYILGEEINDPRKKTEVVRELVGSISKIPDELQRHFYFRECSQRFDIPESLLLEEYNRGVFKERKKFQNRSFYNRNENEQAPSIEDSTLEKGEKKLSESDLTRKREAEVLKLLVQYGNEKIEEFGKLGSYVIEHISDIEFSTKEYVEILEFYRNHDASLGFPTLQDFLEDPALEIFKELVIDLSSERYGLSEEWRRHDIHVPTLEDILGDKLSGDIYRLKWVKVKELLNQVQEEIKVLQEKGYEEFQSDILKLLKQHRYLKKIEKDIASVLGNVISS